MPQSRLSYFSLKACVEPGSCPSVLPVQGRAKACPWLPMVWLAALSLGTVTLSLRILATEATEQRMPAWWCQSPWPVWEQQERSGLRIQACAGGGVWLEWGPGEWAGTALKFSIGVDYTVCWPSFQLQNSSEILTAKPCQQWDFLLELFVLVFDDTFIFPPSRKLRESNW